MSGLASLAGYGSDSDDESAAGPSVSTQMAAPVTSTTKPTPSSSVSSSRLGSILPPPKSGLTSKLPPPTTNASSQRGVGSGLYLPPPTASSSAPNKRKVIKVDSLQSFKDDNDDDGHGDGQKLAETKKPKLGSASSTSKHSLFGMLPAPKRKDDEVLAERKKEADARKAAKAVEESEMPVLNEAPLRINEGEIVRSVSPEAEADGAGTAEASTSKAKGKSNDAFRAMLGLKPAAKPAASKSATTTAATTAATDVSTGEQVSASRRQPQSSNDSTTNGSGISAGSNKTDPAPLDFFSLGTTRTSATASDSSAKSSAFSISAAPIINHPDSQSSSTDPDPHAPESTDEYPGWQLEPDGSWIPITPEAQAQYHAYQQSLLVHPAPSSTTSSKAASNLDGTRDLLAAGLTPDDIRAFDASTAARDAYLSSKGEDGNSDKYAAAAEFAAGNREVQQRKPGMLKGLRKGQLSSLVSLASENRGRMEEKWQRGRDAQARRSNQYGW